MRGGSAARHRAAWIAGTAGLLLFAGIVAASGAARIGRRPANASVVIVARGMLEGTLTPIG